MANDNTIIPKFLTEKRSILLFFGSVFVFAVIFIAIYNPAGDMRTSEALLQLKTYIYTTIQVVAGFLMLSLSRIIFYFLQRHHAIKKHHYILWLIGEIVVIVLSLTIIAVLLNAPNNDLDALQLLRRVATNTAAILVMPYSLTVLIFFLREKHREIEKLNKVISTMEEKPVTGDHLNFYDRGGKLSFSIQRDKVLYIEAADNYSNIHYLNEEKEETIILHNSMKQIDESGLYQGLLRCHRSFMVNIKNVKLVRKDRDGLVLELVQGSRTIPVSRTYNERVVRHFANISSPTQ